jgi:hypothetical protein
MKKRLTTGFIVILATLALVTATSLAYGYNFSLPFAHRTYVGGYSYGDPPSHLAYDYHLSNGEKIAAAMAGNVHSSGWAYADNDNWWEEDECSGNLADRGNYIILADGTDLETWYFHLSRNGNTPGVGHTSPRASIWLLEITPDAQMALICTLQPSLEA